MTASVVQERASSATGTGASIALAFASNVTAGSALHVVGTWGTSANNMSSVTHSLTPAFGAVLNSTGDSTNNQGQAQAVCQNVAGGADTVTINFSTSVSFRGIFIREIGGVTATPLDGNAGQFQAAPGTGTDAISSGTATNANQPVFMSAFTSSTTSATNPTAGTGFTAGLSGGWSTITEGSLAESQRFTTTTAKAGTFSGGVASQNYVTHMAMFDEAGGASAPTYPQLERLTRGLERGIAVGA